MNAFNSMITANDVAEALKCKVKTVYKNIKAQGIPTQTIGNRVHMPSDSTRSYFMDKGYVYKKQVISIQMLKGGVGKSTTAANVAIRASMYGAKVLLIDLDQQANLSYHFGLENTEGSVWIDVVEGTAVIADCIKEINPNLHIIPSNLNNSLLDKVISDGKRNILKAVSQYLKPIKENYDMIIIDTAPNLSATNAAAAFAADLVILPVNPDKFSVSGLEKTMEELDDLGEDFDRTINTKILFTRFDGRESSSNQLLKQCYEHFGDKMLRSFVRSSTEIKNRINTEKTIFDRKSTAKEDYDIVTREILGLM